MTIPSPPVRCPHCSHELTDAEADAIGYAHIQRLLERLTPDSAETDELLRRVAADLEQLRDLPKADE